MDKRLHVLLPWAVAGDMVLLAPWLLGGRSSWAFPILGTMAWASATLVLVSVMIQWWEYRPFAEYDAARGRADKHPLRQFISGAAWALPLWLFILVLIGSAYNPAYLRDASGDLIMQEFNAALPLVIDPDRSRPGIFFLTGLLALLALLDNPIMHPGRKWIRLMLAVLLVNAMILTWVGFWYRFTGADALLGRYEPVADNFFATFYYKNHWAAYAILHCGIAAWFFFRELPRWQEDSSHTGAGGLTLVAILFLGLSVVVVDSSSGMLLFGLLCAIFLFLLYRRLRSRRAHLALSIIALLSASGFACLSYEYLFPSWEQPEKQIGQSGSLLFDSVRAFHTSEVCLKIISIRPIWGWGYLSYDPLFPAYATDHFRDAQGNLSVDMEFAHNDWLQALAEFGAVGAFLLLLGLYPFIIALPRSGMLGIGLSLILLLACWEFPLSNASVLATSVLLLLCINNLKD